MSDSPDLILTDASPIYAQVLRMGFLNSPEMQEFVKTVRDREPTDSATPGQSVAIQTGEPVRVGARVYLAEVE